MVACKCLPDFEECLLPCNQNDVLNVEYTEMQYGAAFDKLCDPSSVVVPDFIVLSVVLIVWIKI